MNTKTFKTLTVMAAMSLLTACGKSPIQQPPAVANNNQSGGNGLINDGSQTGGGGGTNLAPPYSYSFTLNGPNGVYETPAPGLQTDNLLQVRVTPMSAGNINVPGYGFSAPYKCVQLTVTVGDMVQTTNMLAVDGGGPLCQGAPTSQILNFSAALLQGHGPIRVKVSEPYYDFYYNLCLANPYSFLWPYGNYSSCQDPDLFRMRPIYQTHTMRAKIDVQVNGTSI